MFLNRYVKGVPFFNEYKRVFFFNERDTKGYLFCQNGKQKGKGLDLRAEPPPPLPETAKMTAGDSQQNTNQSSCGCQVLFI